MKFNRLNITIIAVFTLLTFSCDFFNGFSDDKSYKRTTKRVIKNNSGQAVELKVYIEGGTVSEEHHILNGDSLVHQADCLYIEGSPGWQNEECNFLEFMSNAGLDSIVIYYDHQKKQRFCSSFEDSCSLGLGIHRYAMHLILLDRGYVFSQDENKTITYTYTISEEDYLSAVDISQ